MLANANPPSEAAPVDPEAIPTDRNVREFIAVCAKHGVDYGEVQNLAGFMLALKENKHFAMDFWSVVARLSEKEGLGTQPHKLLAPIVQAVTGVSVEEVSAAGASQKALVEKLTSMLAGEDIHNPLAKQPFPAETEAEDEFQIASARTRRAKFLQQNSEPPAAAQSRPRKKLATEENIPSAPIVPISSRAWGRNDAPSSSRLVLEPDVKPLESTPAAENTGPDFVPLAAYTDSPERSNIAIAAKAIAACIVIVLLAGLGYLLVRHERAGIIGRLDASAHAGYSSAVAAWHGQSAKATASTSPTLTPSSSGNASGSAATTPNSAAALPATPAPTSAGSTPVTHPAPASQSTASASPTKPVARPQSSAPASNAELRHGLTKQALVAAASESRSSGTYASDSDDDSASRAVVRESVMKNSLISSRVPVYPDDARARNISGQVTMEAVINKDGSVGHLHVIDGNPALRHAALEAVSNWRYIPYQINGRPTDVATTISVYVGPNER